jgi:hypothetical protein
LQELLPAVAPGDAIPRVIHQVYFTKQLPPEIRDNVDKLRSLNPGWEYKLYDDDHMAQFISSRYGSRVLGYYSRINKRYGASRADVFRYLLIYQEGGVYLDIKSSLQKPLDEVIRVDDVYLLSRWRNAIGERYAGWGMHNALRRHGGQELQQWHIIAAPGHPFSRAVITHVMQNIDDYNPLFQSTGKGGVIRVTGPIAYTRSIMPLLHLHRHRMVDSEKDLGLVYSIYDSTNTGSHKRIFKTHYTELREPVTKLKGPRKLLWHAVGPLQNAFRRVRNAVYAVRRGR